jgi:hypothetical protein
VCLFAFSTNDFLHLLIIWKLLESEIRS